MLGRAGYRNTVNRHPRNNQRKRTQSGATVPSRGQGQVRIIGGQWRGRKLEVADVEGLRPTGDRVRETLFNWLQADIAGAHCLDLFAGSGALGFECLSRYAASVSFVEPDSSAQSALEGACRLLNVQRGAQAAGDIAEQEADQAKVHIHAGTAEHALAHWRSQQVLPEFNLVFIDPPFEMGCQWSVLEALVPDFVADNALIYVEAPFDAADAADEQGPWPNACSLVREKRFGDVQARLLRYHDADVAFDHVIDANKGGSK